MPQLYIFIIAILAIAIIVGRRNFIFNRNKKKIFKEKIGKKVKEYKKKEQEEYSRRFKEDYNKKRGEQKFNLAKFKEEVGKADMAISKKQWNLSKKHLIQALSLARDEFSVSIKLAKVYMESQDFKRAETLYHRLLEDEPDNFTIYENLAKIYTKKRRFKDAIEAYSRAVELNEKDDKNLVALGKLYYLLMRYSLAAECFRRAAELKPRDVEYLFLLANACIGDSDYDNALFTYEKILTVEPYNEQAKNSAQDVRLKLKEEESFLQVT